MTTMRLLYQAEHLYDAQMVHNLLQQHGLHGWIEGAALIGAVGELPANNLVRVVVANSDYEAARQLLNDWQNAQFELPNPAEATDTINTTKATHEAFLHAKSNEKTEFSSIHATVWVGIILITIGMTLHFVKQVLL